MSPKLTLSAFTRALAALGAVSVSACGGAAEPATSPVDAKEVPAATEATPSAEAPAADAPPIAAAPAAGMAPVSNETATPAEADATGAKKEPSEVAPAAPAAQKKPTAKKKAAGAHSGCGAGTCG